MFQIVQALDVARVRAPLLPDSRLFEGRQAILDVVQPVSRRRGRRGAGSLGCGPHLRQGAVNPSFLAATSALFTIAAYSGFLFGADE